MKRRVHPDVAAFEPCSGVATLQERTRGDPWRCLVVCVLLNRTRGSVAEPYLWELFRRWPNASNLAVADEDEVADLLRPLGLQRRRASILVRLSRGYVAGDPVESLPGVGRYALDSWALFVEERRDVEPDDRVLRRFVEFSLR